MRYQRHLTVHYLLMIKMSVRQLLLQFSTFAIPQGCGLQAPHSFSGLSSLRADAPPLLSQPTRLRTTLLQSSECTPLRKVPLVDRIVVESRSVKRDQTQLRTPRLRRSTLFCLLSETTFCLSALDFFKARLLPVYSIVCHGSLPITVSSNMFSLGLGAPELLLSTHMTLDTKAATGCIRAYGCPTGGLMSENTSSLRIHHENHQRQCSVRKA